MQFSRSQFDIFNTRKVVLINQTSSDPKLPSSFSHNSDRVPTLLLVQNENKLNKLVLFVMNVNKKLHHRAVSQHILNQFMRKSSILVMNVNIKLHHRAVSRNIRSECTNLRQRALSFYRQAQLSTHDFTLTFIAESYVIKNLKPHPC